MHKTKIFKNQRTIARLNQMVIFIHIYLKHLKLSNLYYSVFVLEFFNIAIWKNRKPKP